MPKIKPGVVILFLVIIAGWSFAAKEILYYRNPMNPQITSPVPMKDSMGMDYVPVYAEPAKVAKEAGVYINLAAQKLVGIKTSIVQTKIVTSTITAPGVVAYDPELFIQQEEYLQSLKTATLAATPDEQSLQLIEAAQQKLKLAGMTSIEIEALAQAGKPQQNLYLPENSSTVWVYFNLYEQEINLLKPGANVALKTVAVPGHVFTGIIRGASPVVDPETRAVRVRAEVRNDSGLLKPGMFVSAEVSVALGKILVVPDLAVLDTGTRTIVFVAAGANRFVAQAVKAGRQIGDLREIISGLKPGERIVSEGSFYVDSESKLKPE